MGMNNLTTNFTNRDKAITYAQGLEANHDVDVREVEQGKFTVYVDEDTCYTSGYKVYSNLNN